MACCSFRGVFFSRDILFKYLSISLLCCFYIKFRNKHSEKSERTGSSPGKGRPLVSALQQSTTRALSLPFSSSRHCIRRLPSGPCSDGNSSSFYEGLERLFLFFPSLSRSSSSSSETKRETTRSRSAFLPCVGCERGGDLREEEDQDGGQSGG